MSFVELSTISKSLNKLESKKILEKCINYFFENKIAYVCSFGAESAILLHMISNIERNLPVVFINTLKLFNETIDYKNRLVREFSLKNVIELTPSKEDVELYDSEGKLWLNNPDKCCNFRKVKILDNYLNNFQAWFSGRKGYQSDERSKNNTVELQDKKFIISPLISWKKKDVDDYYIKYNLPRHPLSDQGFLSIGCKNCTSKTMNLSDIRSGRWSGLQKTECGIYKSNNIIK